MRVGFGFGPGGQINSRSGVRKASSRPTPVSRLRVRVTVRVRGRVRHPISSAKPSTGRARRRKRFTWLALG